MQLTRKPTQFDAGLAYRSAATPTCSSCCCCCCCIATVVTTPLLTGATTGVLSNSAGTDVHRAKAKGLLGGLAIMATFVVAIIVTAAFSDPIGALGGLWWLVIIAMWLAVVIVGAGVFASITKSLLSRTAGIWTGVGTVVVFTIALVLEAVLAILLIFSTAGIGYLVFLVVAIPAATVLYAKIQPRPEEVVEPEAVAMSFGTLDPPTGPPNRD